MKRVVFPFAAVPGQEKAKNALLWNLVNPKVGGVLLSGEKGTAKSTLARGLAVITDGQKVVELPLNVTEDRLVGAVDFSRALLDGQSVLEPGILMEADGNILYADEVNLLSDFAVNALLEAAASGRNVVEREGISCAHDSRFVLIGSMNPEEGKLRPQLLDRFGLYVEVEGEKDVSMRVEIMRRRLQFEQDPQGFLRRWEGETLRLKKKVLKARELLPEVSVTENVRNLAASLAADAGCCGHRGEIAVVEAARAAAALGGRKLPNTEDIREAAKYALAHRAGGCPSVVSPVSPGNDDSEKDGEQEENAGKSRSPEDGAKEQDQELSSESGQGENGADTQNPAASETGKNPEDGRNGPGQEEESKAQRNGSGKASGWNDSADRAGEAMDDDGDLQEGGETFLIPRWQEAAAVRKICQGSGRRNLIRSKDRQGRYVRYRPAGEEKISDLAFDATLRAAAPFQNVRDKRDCAVAIRRGDMRIKIREKRTGGCILFVVDASASMGANRRMREVKAAVLSLLNFSYQKRDRVGMIAFRKDRAELLLGITRSVELAQKKLENLPTGGKTPLAAGLNLAFEVVMGLKTREPEADPVIVLVSDGRASGKKEKNSSPFAEALRVAERIGNRKIRAVILDTESGFIKFHLCDRLNEKMRGTVVTMEELRAEGIVEAVRGSG